MSEQRSPLRAVPGPGQYGLGSRRAAPPPDESRIRKAGRTRAPGPAIRDWPVGRQFVAEFKERDGFQVFLLCEVADAYVKREFQVGWDDNGLCLYARVLGASPPAARYRDLIGHLTRVVIKDQSFPWDRQPRVSRMTPAGWRDFLRAW